MSLVYGQLHRLAVGCLRSESPGHTLRATALVNEAYLRLVRADVDWADRVHFFAVSARVMRHILVDYAKAGSRQKRAGAAEAIPLDDTIIVANHRFEELLALNDAIEHLGLHDHRKKDILELVLFGGLTYEEVGAELGLSPPTVQRELKFAKAWLRRELKPAAGQGITA